MSIARFLAWLEGSGLGHLMRSSGVWSYGLVNLAHILGVALLFGSVVILDLRLVGAWKQIPLPSIARPSMTISAIGLCIILLTGPALLATKATEYYGNPFLYIKLPAVALGLINLVALRFSPAWRALDSGDKSPQTTRRLRLAGAVSLLCWTIAISMGRMIGYW